MITAKQKELAEHPLVSGVTMATGTDTLKQHRISKMSPPPPLPFSVVAAVTGGSGGQSWSAEPGKELTGRTGRRTGHKLVTMGWQQHFLQE